ncbi:hypothetical protein AOX58_10725 [Acinetobacter baumannii]|uniref:hypothetical protein n=1 Tax=Acinetobacter baumannii TaxID=470 RepID=UPI000707BB28|nr:hypothetical protein [Acinetobacter baumannii]KQK67639.1 hypothetical protein AOX58_10725 [Acinetobacter baumannii]
MSGSNSTVSLTLQIKGHQAAQEMKRISDQQIQATTKINTQWTQVASAQAKFVNTAKVGTRETLNTARAGDQLLRTNKMLEGVLRQQSIQTKLQNQLLKQQVGSVQQLANWSKQVEQSSKRTHQSTQQTMSLWQKGSAIGGAVIGAGYALQQPIKRTVDYDRDLHYAAQTFADRPEDWGPAKKWINTIVTGNAINGGVTRNDAFLAMETLIADGSYSQGSDLNKNKAALAKAHYDAARSALASGGEMLDFANVGLTARKRGLDEKYVQAMVIQGDAEGSMRAKDLAKVINPQLGLLPKDPANNARSVAQLVALNEVAMTTAGDANDAGTNVKNLISKLSSSDTSKRLAKEYDIDLAKRTALDKGKGKTSLDTFLDIAEEIISKNPEMQRVKANLAKAKNNQETQAIWESQKGVFEQSGLAEIMPDMQSLLALVAATNNRKLMEQITQNALNKGVGTLDLKANYNKTQLASVGINAFDVTRQNAEYQTLQDSTKLLGEMGQKVAEVTNKYPELITAMGATELALKALAFTAGGAALAQIAASKKVDIPLSTTAKGAATQAVGGASALGGVAAAYAGSQLIKPIDDAGYNLVSGLLAKIGIGSGGESPDFVQQAIEQSKAQQASAEEKSNKLIAEQQKQNQLSQDLINKMNTLIDVTGQNKPTINFSGGLLGAISENAVAQEKRHGAPNVPFYLQKH